MQKFGLRRNSSSHHSAIELEIIKEQASALGRAGRKLRLSLERYQLEFDQIQDNNKDTYLSQDHDVVLEISNNVWELILQREFLGFTENNFQWIKDNYVIPRVVLQRLALI